MYTRFCSTRRPSRLCGERFHDAVTFAVPMPSDLKTLKRSMGCSILPRNNARTRQNSSARFIPDSGSCEIGIEKVTFATVISVVKTPACQPSPESDASALALICHRSFAFAPSTRACHRNTAQRSTYHRTVCISPLRQVITYWV